MCEYPCLDPKPEVKYRKLTPLLLDCWQREYDKRPYCSFKFERLKFEERLERDYDPKRDFAVIVSFLRERTLNSIRLVGLEVIAENVSMIKNFVINLQKITCIELKLMNLPTELFKQLANNAINMRVKELSLEGTPLNDDDIDHLHSFILKSSTLETLNVSRCSINQYNFAQLADAIFKSATLKACNISHLLGLHLAMDSEKVAHILASLIWQNKLEELALENCDLLGHDMEILAEFLYRKDSKLQILNISYNKIGANGAQELFNAISSSKSLKTLKINGCSLLTHGGEIVAHYLCFCLNLESLALTNNQIEAEAINMILLCMKKSCKLLKLSLWGNMFDARSGEILRRLLDSGVLPQDSIDVTVTYDDTIKAYRVIPWN